MTATSAQREYAIEVVKTLRKAGFAALWAGGCVRDELLNLQPKDFDVATDATPKQVQQVFGPGKTLSIGAAFGVVAVRGKKKQGQVEVATFRSDGGYSDGRRPDSVTFSTPEQDALRRDFTINGLFYDPIEDRVIDYVGGREDLKNGILKAIGNPRDRISEDKLRMLRAVRFATTYDLTMDPDTFLAVQENASRLALVSRERIIAELKKIFCHGNRYIGLKHLSDSGLMTEIFQTADFLELERFDRALRLFEHLETTQFECAFAGYLIACLNRSAAESSRTNSKKILNWCNEWKLSNQESSLITWLIFSSPDALSASDSSWPQVQPILIHPDIDLLLQLGDALVRAEQFPHSNGLAFCQEKLQLPSEQLNPAPLIDGSDLIELGLTPGQEFKSILESVRKRQLMGQLLDRHSAIEFARQCVKDC